MLEPTLPDISSTSSTISDHDLQAMKTLTNALPRSFYAAFCCFKPVHSDLHCLLPHLKRKSSKFLTFDFKQNGENIELLSQQTKLHLLQAHSFNINGLADREWISDGVNYISLKQMVIKIAKYLKQLLTLFCYSLSRCRSTTTT